MTGREALLSALMAPSHARMRTDLIQTQQSARARIDAADL